VRNTLVAAEIVEPYPQALMSLAQSHDLVDRFGEDVGTILGLLGSSDDLAQLLFSPLIKADVKRGVLRQIVSDQVHPYMLSFLMLLVDRGRSAFLEGICKAYQSLLRKLRQTVLAEVVSAVELNDEQKEAVRQKVRNLVGAQQVDLDARIEPDILGGVIIKVGSQVIDASLRGQLRRIGLRLNSAT
jgi:F-type H+-transporting ATPase subunit delta